jgi:hypothetical protein
MLSFQVLWLVLRFFLLATELSVIIFGLAFGKSADISLHTVRPIKKKLVYHPYHPKKVRRKGGFYFFIF